MSTKETRTLPASVQAAAKKRLDFLHAAMRLSDLANIPSLRLEALKGDLKGYYSIRINIQHRIVFRWSGSNASQVEVTDYH